ncbi:MAG: S-layer homology domain-containing protein [Ruminococcaceae bacterium]|nr:S-layer homology domain-containing protein [Oscillospiraceae bacterium]
MKRRVVAAVLALIMVIGVIPAFALGTENAITVYFSMSKYGELVKGKNGADVACAEVKLQGKESYTLDDAFMAAHEKYCPDGEEGYASSVSEQWGLSVDQLWGDTSYNFGYQVNGGRESVMGPGHVVEDGDYIDACIYQNEYPNSEAYSFFDVYRTQAYPAEEITLTLTYASGYDDDWNTIYLPCEGATITVNGEETDVITDAEGKAIITLDEVGKYIISAKKSKILDEENQENEEMMLAAAVPVPAITAPVCVVEIINRPEIQIMHNIAEQYADLDVAEADGNLPWIVADMVAYQTAFPESEIVMSEEKKQAALETVVSLANESTKPGDLAKAILAIRALGYDAADVYTQTFDKINVPEKLTALIDSQDASVTNVYTLPYVMIALAQGEGYATAEQTAWLVNAAVERASVWLDTANGTDAMTPMIVALAPHYSTNDAVKACVDEAMVILQAEQREDGLIDGFLGYEGASTGLAICAFSAMGVDAAQILNGEKSLIDGIMSTANEQMNGFSNAFATEQGFRGLLAWYMLSEGLGDVYDFADAPMRAVDVSGVSYCPVVFEVSPQKTVVTIEGQTAVKENCFDLQEGTYTYEAKASGYKKQSGEVVVSAGDVLEKRVKRIAIDLDRIPAGNSNSGGGSMGGASSALVDEEVSKQEGQKEQLSDEEASVAVETVFSDVTSEDWFHPAVQFVYENKLFSGTDKGFEPDVCMTRGMLVTVLYRLAAPDKVPGENPFEDVHEDDWYADAVKWAAEKGVVSGVSDTQFAPDTDITREQLALILYRYAEGAGYDVSGQAELLPYGDADEISDYAKDAMEYAVWAGIISGKGENILAPQERATRAEVATMLMRFLRG